MTTPGDESRTELAWREIVQHYGDRPVLDDDARQARASGDDPPAPEHEHEHDSQPDTQQDTPPDEGPDTDTDADIPVVDRFRPPPPPPFPVPRTWERGLAWAGIAVAPAIALVIGLFSIYVAPIIGWALVLWFVGGFGYLVRSMPRSPRDPWDDGSRI